MKTDRRIVNNRVFLFGLDEIYREAMKRHERDERPVVNEFWDTEIWTTARYRAEQEAKEQRRP